MLVVTVSSDNFEFGLSIRELLRIWGKIIEHKEDEIIIDLSHCRFCNCCLLLGLHLLHKNLSQEGCRISLNTDCIHPAFASYLVLTSFTEGLNPNHFSSEQMDQLLLHYQNRTYLPLLDFPATELLADSQIRDRLLSFLSQSIQNKLHLDPQIFIAVSYLITEAVNNIKDHARTPRGYLFTQFYPRKGLMDICFADLGVSLLGSYQAVERTDVNSPVIAMQSALNGDSTKGELHRGFGIRTSREMLVHGLGGRYFMMSGNAFLDSRPGVKDKINVFPERPGIQWDGTYLALRIPIQAKPGFDYIKYVE